MVYFKNKRHKNNSVCLAICVCVLALIWYLICEKWVWNNKVLDIWSTLGRIRKVAVLKSRTRFHLSCRCPPGSSNTRMVFYFASRTESIPPSQSAFYFGINPKLTGQFLWWISPHPTTRNSPLIWALAPCLPKVVYVTTKVNIFYHSFGLGAVCLSIKSKKMRTINKND